MQRYVMSIILDYVHKYVENFKPEHAELSLFRGDVSLYNLLLKTDVLQKELSLPFTLVSGRINELFIHVSWASLATEPILVKIDTIECTLSQRKPEEEPTQNEGDPVVVGTPPSYMQGIIRRIVNSISLQVDHLILKYVEDDIVLSLNVNNLAVHSMDEKWMAAVLADNIPEMRRQITIDDLTLCLDKTDSDGKIRFYQEPLLCKCKLLIRVLTVMASPITREAVCHRIQMSSPNIAIGMTNEQLVLILRLLKNLNNPQSSPTYRPASSSSTQTDLINRLPNSSSESWARWAWSWLPSWTDDSNELLTAARPNLPKSVGFLARLDNISIRFKVMKTFNNKRRPHDLFEFRAKYTAVRGLIRVPTLYQIKIGCQYAELWTKETCCGPNSKRMVMNQDMLVIRQYSIVNYFDNYTYTWPEEVLENEEKIMEPVQKVETDKPTEEESEIRPGQTPKEVFEALFWKKLSPHITVEFNHERSPPLSQPNSSPTTNFEYSDWIEQCTFNVKMKTTELIVTTGLIHRINMIREIVDSFDIQPELVRKTLTLEECEALTENIPQRRINFEWEGMRLRVASCDHSPVDTDPAKVFLNVESPLLKFTVTAPLYDHRVCSAASQIPKDEGPLWQAARVHVSAKLESIEFSISSVKDREITRPIMRLDISIFMHYLLHQKYFVHRNSVIFSYVLKIKEINICGSAPRLLVAIDTLTSSVREEINTRIKETSLCDDAFEDHVLAAVDINVEDISLRGSLTNNMINNAGFIRTIRATVLRAIVDSEPKQAWLFSGPEMPTNNLFIEFMFQYTIVPNDLTLDCIRLRSETMALSLDPLLYECLTYRPTVITVPKENPLRRVATEPATSRKNTPPSSSGRGGSRAESSTEPVHSAKLPSQSSDTASEYKDSTGKEQSKSVKKEKTEVWWTGESSLKIYQRFRRTLLDINTGLAMFYAPTTSPSAVGSVTVREAMEKHSVDNKYILGLSIAGYSIESNTYLQHLVSEMRADGPNFFTLNHIRHEDCFPWKITIKEITLYTLDTRTAAPKTGREKSPDGLRSCLTTSFKPEQKKLFHLLETTVTVPIIIKRLPFRNAPAQGKSKKKKKDEPSTSDEAVKYLSSGVSFKPTTLKDFIRGPAKFRVQTTEPTVPEEPKEVIKTFGPISSICLGLHVVTTPINITIEDYQVQPLMTMLHCLEHYVAASGENPAGKMLEAKTSWCPLSKENEDVVETRTEELVSIYESPREIPKLKTSLWFQWAADRIDVSLMSETGRLFLELEDILSSIDLQAAYKQHKIKVHTANLRYQTRKPISDQYDDWIIDPLRSKVIHPFETKKDQDVPHFLHVTITHAMTESLPANWKPDYLPKSSKTDLDVVWEILINVASFKIVLRPEVIRHCMAFIKDITSAHIWLNKNHIKRPTLPAEWPLLFINCVGLRVLVTNENDKVRDTEETNTESSETAEDETLPCDDSIIFDMGRIELQPYPNNPICRKALSSDMGRLFARGGVDGKQYEITIEDIGIKTGKFCELVEREATLAEVSQRLGGENPAAIWNKRQTGDPITTPIVDSLKIGCILAPAMTDSVGSLIFSQALELNIMSDLNVELSLYQLNFMWKMASNMNTYIRNSIVREFDIIPAQCLTYMQLPAIKSRFSNILYRRLQNRKSNSTDSGVNSDGGPPVIDILQPPDICPSTEHDKSECLEVFLTMGNVEFSLYIIDDGKNELIAKIPPTGRATPKRKPDLHITETETPAENTIREQTDDSKRALSVSGSQSLDDIRPVEPAPAALNLGAKVSPARKRVGVIPLCYFFFQQPNMYLIQQQGLTKLQLSLFNTQIGFGARGIDGLWHDVLVDTARGIPDPVTDIPPALFTLKATKPNKIPGNDILNVPITGRLCLDVERPVAIDITEEKITRTKVICEIIESVFGKIKKVNNEASTNTQFYHIKNTMENFQMAEITLSITQVSLNGQLGSISLDSLVHQTATSSRPERLLMRTLVKGVMVTMRASNDTDRHPFLHPFMFGFEIDCNWKNGTREAGIWVEKDFNMKILVDLDNIVIDVRPQDVFEIIKFVEQTKKIFFKPESEKKPEARPRLSFTRAPECNKHLYYSNDLRSGAFKLSSDGKFPIAYQLHVHGDLLTWTYPNLRAIRKLTILPLPENDEGANCVLEYYCEMFERWEPHTYFDLSGEIVELPLNQTAPDAVFAHTWRFRLYPNQTQKFPNFYFQDKRFLSRTDPLMIKNTGEECLSTSGKVTANQLYGMIVLDSVSCSCTIPIVRISSRIASVSLHLHNSLYELPSCDVPVEGYYLSEKLRKSHRMLSFILFNECIRFQMTENNRTCTTFETAYKCNIMDSATGSFEELFRESNLQVAVVTNRPNDFVYTRTKCRTTPVYIRMHVPRLRTLESLVDDWLREYIKKLKSEPQVMFDDVEPMEDVVESVENIAQLLEGRVSIWIKNDTVLPLRMGQKGTTEIVSVAPGTAIAYRWHSPRDEKKIHFALGCPTPDVSWSHGLELIDGKNRLLIADDEALGGVVYLYTRVETVKSTKWLYLSGRVTLANLMKFSILYKIKFVDKEKQTSRAIYSGEIPAESASQTVLCGEQCDLMLKLKMTSLEIIWSGDIPLRPSPKEVPWLVKVPVSGSTPYISMWCRVVRSESDNRLLASIWPLYILRSNLPLDAIMYLETQNDDESVPLRKSIQNAAGRGQRSHILVPGTTSSKHTLKFRYKDMDTPVTRDDILLNYNVTNKSIFEKVPPVIHVSDSIAEINAWLNPPEGDYSAAWPFSTVAKHIANKWKPTILQPRADCIVQYIPIKVGGGSSLEFVISPAMLLCNAFPAAVTLRGYDANPVCRAEFASVIAPGSSILEKAFYLSLEINREPVVGQPLNIWRKPIGQYEELPEGHVAIDHPAQVFITSEFSFSLLNVYYEVINGIELLGVTSTHTIINHLDAPLKVLGVIVSQFIDPVTIPTRSSKIIPPHDSDDWLGTPFGTFWIIGPWHPNTLCSLKKYICIAFGDDDNILNHPLPILIEGNSTRRSISLQDSNGNSIPIVVTQHIIDKRIYITLAHDICPQYYIKNLTNFTIAVAEPLVNEDGETAIIQDCAGAKWHYKVYPDSYIYYTTPNHCVEFPKLEKGQSLKETKNTSLIIGIYPDNFEESPEWSQPIKVTTTKHWLKFKDEYLIKVFTREYPHSTLIKLETIKKDDISPESLRNFISNGDFHLSVLDLDRRLLEEDLSSNNSKLGSGSKQSANNSKCNIVKRQKSISTNESKLDSGSKHTVHDSKSRRKPNEWFDGKISGIVFEMAASASTTPLIIVHLDDVVVSIQDINSKDKVVEITASNVQVDNPQFDSGEFDFGVVATTNASRVREVVKQEELCNIFSEKSYIINPLGNDPIQIRIQIDYWSLYDESFHELTELTIRVSPISLYIEDCYVRAIVDLYRAALPSYDYEDLEVKSEALTLRKPLRLRRLLIEPMDVVLTLHTAVRLYIALDESPMSLSEFSLRNIMTSSERLSQALTVHYLSAALLGAGWVVGGLELLGAPGAIASRVGNASGGIRGVAMATAAAFIKSISAWAASLARNLDLLAGDDEHTLRAAAIRRRPPDRFFAGLVQGFSNFGINLLGAVGGIAHHPLVGVAVGENGGAMGLRRGLVGAVTKPLSAAADLVALAGNSLLRQAGWDPTPERRMIPAAEVPPYWCSNSIRWSLRLPNTTILGGYEALLDEIPVYLLITSKALVVGEPESENILEIIDFSKCVVEKRDGPEIVIIIKTDQHRERRSLHDDDYQMSDETLARLARYTGALHPDSTANQLQTRRLSIETSPNVQHSLLTAMTTLIHQNDSYHFNLV